MSNAKTYQGKAESIVVHYTTHRLRLESPVACGVDGWNATSTRKRYRVTCKRCLASLAKRDQAFQRKARVHFGPVPPIFTRSVWGLRGRQAAARAIAAEEGRARP
jgi:hypothetical protein